MAFYMITTDNKIMRESDTLNDTTNRHEIYGYDNVQKIIFCSHTATNYILIDGTLHRFANDYNNHKLIDTICVEINGKNIIITNIVSSNTIYALSSDGVVYVVISDKLKPLQIDKVDNIYSAATLIIKRNTNEYYRVSNNKQIFLGCADYIHIISDWSIVLFENHNIKLINMIINTVTDITSSNSLLANILFNNINFLYEIPEASYLIFSSSDNEIIYSKSFFNGTRLLSNKNATEYKILCKSYLNFIDIGICYQSKCVYRIEFENRSTELVQFKNCVTNKLIRSHRTKSAAKKY
jgi:hypothetical protein